MLLTPLVRDWQGRGLGFPYLTPDGQRLATMVVWADNIFILSADWEQWSIMFSELCAVMWSADLPLKPGATKVLSSRGLPTLEERFGSAVMSWVGQEEGERLDIEGVNTLSALGAELDRDGDPKTSMGARMGQADACFFKHKVLLRNTRNPPGARIQAFHRSCGMSFAHGSNGWGWTKEMLVAVRTWERNRLRSVLRCRWNPDKQTFEAYRRTTAAMIGVQMDKSGIRPLHLQMLAGVFGWCHQLVHLRWKGPEYPLLNLILSRSELWWQGLRPLLSHYQHHQRVHVIHRRRGVRHRTWEMLIHDVIGPDWHQRLLEVRAITKLAKQRWADEAASKLWLTTTKIARPFAGG